MRTSDNRTRLDVAIIGGGISGLAAAWELKRCAAELGRPLETRVFEARDRFGGVIDTAYRQGFVIERGADSLLTEKPEAMQLVRELGIEDEVIATREDFRRTLVVQSGRVYEVPEGFFMLAPARLLPFVLTPTLSVRGKARAMLDLLLPRGRVASDPPASGNGNAKHLDEQVWADESIASFVRRRLGREVLERLAEPLAGGIYTGDVERLSISATMPRLVELERRHRSIILGLLRARRGQANRAHAGEGGARYSLFVSFRGGMRTLITALEEALAPALIARAEVLGVEREAGRWTLRLADGRRFEADAVILAVPTYAAVRLLPDSAERLRRLLGRVTYCSSASVALGFCADGLSRGLPPAFGMVVPAIERRKILACSFVSRKFEGRAPGGHVLLRAFVTPRTLGGSLQDFDDDLLASTVRAELRALLGITGPPVITDVSRHPRAMPQYEIGHRDLVRQIMRETAAVPGLALAGSAFDGVGVPDCVRSGRAAARAVLRSIQGEVGARLKSRDSIN